MARRDKNRSFNEWEDDWNDKEYEDSKKTKQQERRKNRAKKYDMIDEWEKERDDE